MRERERGREEKNYGTILYFIYGIELLIGNNYNDQTNTKQKQKLR